MISKAWIIVDHEKIGARNQCLGLSKALGLEPVLKCVDVNPIFRYLPSVLWPRSLRVLRPHSRRLFEDADLPSAFIASGRKALIPGVTLKKMHPSIPFILLQKPSMFKKVPDIILLPEHDHYKGKNVLTMIGNPHAVSAQGLKDELHKFKALKSFTVGKKVVAILLGGPNKAFDFPVECISRVLQKLLSELEMNVDMVYLVTLSRRTPQMIHDYIMNIHHPRMYVWDGQGPNPYLAFLGLADMFVMTTDSIAMASEAASTGKPIHLIHLPGKSKKFDQFHASLKELGISRDLTFPLEGWRCTPLNETKRVAKHILTTLPFK